MFSFAELNIQQKQQAEKRETQAERERKREIVKRGREGGAGVSRVSKTQCGKNGKMSSSSAAKRSKPSWQQQLAMRLKKPRRGGIGGKGKGKERGQ